MKIEKPCLKAVALLVAFGAIAPPALADQSRCELTKIAGLAAWSQPAQQYWRDEIEKQVSERTRAFVQTGEFKPASYELNGSTAGILAANMERVKLRREVGVRRQVIESRVPGTEIPVYVEKVSVDTAFEDVVKVESAAYKLPVRPEDLPPGASESILVDATCKSDEAATVAVAAKSGPKTRPH